MKSKKTKVAIVNPEHLLEQARELIDSSGRKRPRQVSLRRAISTSYYAIFHETCIVTADRWVGVAYRATSRYALVYRSIDHRSLKTACEQAAAGRLPQKSAAYLGRPAFGEELVAFATAAAQLQERRHTADYDPVPLFRRADAALTIETAETALRDFRSAPELERSAFEDLLLFKPR